MFSFRIALSGRKALRNSPGEYRKPITRAATGARFKCTLKIDRKMPIRTAGPPMNSSCSSRVISTTLPSAGETNRPGSCGTRRGGSRKK